MGFITSTRDMPEPMGLLDSKQRSDKHANSRHIFVYFYDIFHGGSEFVFEGYP